MTNLTVDELRTWFHDVLLPAVREQVARFNSGKALDDQGSAAEAASGHLVIQVPAVTEPLGRVSVRLNMHNLLVTAETCSDHTTQIQHPEPEDHAVRVFSSEKGLVIVKGEDLAQLTNDTFAKWLINLAAARVQRGF